MTRAITRASAMLCAMLAIGSPRARAAEAGDDAARPKRTVLHFEDDSIRGDLKRPDGELVQAPRLPPSPSLLRMRRSFADRALSGVVRGDVSGESHGR